MPEWLLCVGTLLLPKVGPIDRDAAATAAKREA
jgi:hypothetical protein